MQRHWKAIQWMSVAAMFGVIISIMYGWFYVTYGIIVTAAIGIGVYLISVAPFKGRHDAEPPTREDDTAKHSPY